MSAKSKRIAWKTTLAKATEQGVWDELTGALESLTDSMSRLPATQPDQRHWSMRERVPGIDLHLSGMTESEYESYGGGIA